jgi:hypothetical protein
MLSTTIAKRLWTKNGDDDEDDEDGNDDSTQTTNAECGAPHLFLSPQQQNHPEILHLY